MQNQYTIVIYGDKDLSQSLMQEILSQDNSVILIRLSDVNRYSDMRTTQTNRLFSTEETVTEIINRQQRRGINTVIQLPDYIELSNSLRNNVLTLNVDKVDDLFKLQIPETKTEVNSSSIKTISSVCVSEAQQMVERNSQKENINVL